MLAVHKFWPKISVARRRFSPHPSTPLTLLPYPPPTDPRLGPIPEPKAAVVSYQPINSASHDSSFPAIFYASTHFLCIDENWAWNIPLFKRTQSDIQRFTLFLPKSRRVNNLIGVLLPSKQLLIGWCKIISSNIISWTFLDQSVFKGDWIRFF